MKNRRGLLVMIDGIDGSGKGTATKALASWAKIKKLAVLDLKTYWKKNHTFPEPAELKKYQVIISAEPTFSMVGQAIREEIVRDNQRNYSAFTTAEAFALDREILYRRVIIPALAAGKFIFQERGVTTSLAYQPVQAELISLKTILGLRGNQLALEYRPDLLVITTLKPEIALDRLKKRTKKMDQSIFEKLNFLKKVEHRFQADWFKKIFTNLGSSVVYLDTSGSIEKENKDVIEIWEKFLKSKTKS